MPRNRFHMEREVAMDEKIRIGNDCHNFKARAMGGKEDLGR